MAFSKGLKAPGGSPPAGSQDLITATDRYRRQGACAGPPPGAPVQLDLSTVQTSIGVIHLPLSMAMDAPTLAARAGESGVLVNAFDPRTVRAVTHPDVDLAHCEHDADVRVAPLAGQRDACRPDWADATPHGSSSVRCSGWPGGDDRGRARPSAAAALQRRHQAPPALPLASCPRRDNHV